MDPIGEAEHLRGIEVNVLDHLGQVPGGHAPPVNTDDHQPGAVEERRDQIRLKLSLVPEKPVTVLKEPRGLDGAGVGHGPGNQHGECSFRRSVGVNLSLRVAMEHRGGSVVFQVERHRERAPNPPEDLVADVVIHLVNRDRRRRGFVGLHREPADPDHVPGQAFLGGGGEIPRQLEFGPAYPLVFQRREDVFLVMGDHPAQHRVVVGLGIPEKLEAFAGRHIASVHLLQPAYRHDVPGVVLQPHQRPDVQGPARVVVGPRIDLRKMQNPFARIRLHQYGGA
jgi:hypothetical protein